MADEIGDLCDHCSGVSVTEPPALRAKPLYQAPLTWILIVLNIGFYFVGHSGSRDPWDLYAAYGPAVLSGAWWRLLTALFTHQGLVHLLDNMFVLWLFGRRAERIFGAWMMLGLYLACGLAGAETSLAVHPEWRCAGASGSIMGLAGLVLITYAIRYGNLTTRQRWKFWIVTVWTVFALTPAVHKPGEMATDLADHLGGFSAGLILGGLLTSLATQRNAVRLRVMVCALAALVLAGVATRWHNAYAIHLEAADRALDRGDEASARKELQVALAMRSRSRLAESIRERIESRHSVPDSCQTLLSFEGKPISSQEVCRGIECDGQFHTLDLPFGGRRLTYEGHLDAPIFCSQDGEIWKQTTANLHVQEFDDQGKTLCTKDWKGEWKDKLEKLPAVTQPARWKLPIGINPSPPR